MASTVTTVTPVLLEHIRDGIEQIWFNPDDTLTPLLAGMEAKSANDGGGTGYKIRMLYSKGSSASQTFSVAQGISQGAVGGHAALGDSWIVQAYTTDATAQWNRDVMLAGEGNTDDMFDIMTTETDAKIALIREHIGVFGWESGYGRIGTMTAVGSSTITLPTSVVNRIHVGDFIAASATATGALYGGGNTRVTQIADDNGSGGTVVTVADDVSGGAFTWGATATVFRAGDHTSGVLTCPVGMPGWVPTTAPSGAFMGVTRTGIPELCGSRQSYSGQDHSTALIKGAATLTKRGYKATECYMAAEDFGVLTCDKESVKTVAMTLGKYEIGFEAFPLLTPNGTIKVLPDIYMEQGNYWMGPFSNKKYAPFLLHNNDLVNVDTTDGNTLRSLAASTALEMRLFFRGAIGMVAPGAFHVGTGLATS